jgi:hypothetical protein
MKLQTDKINRAPLLLLVLPALLFLPYLTEFLYSSGAPYSDLTISHYPNAVFLRQSLLSEGQLPFWSSNILSGYPFAANPLSGMWYIPGWLALIFPLPFGFNLLFVLHILFGGAGCYLFLRQMGVGQMAALLGGLIFELGPKYVSHYAAGHLTLIYAVAWTPWLLVFENLRYHSSRRKWLQPGLALAFIALADIRWLPYAALLWVCYAITLKRRSDQVSRRQWRIKIFLVWCVKHLLGQLVLSVLLSAVLLIPLLEYTRLSTRSGLAAAESMIFSVSPEQLLGLLLPDFGAQADQTIYLGVMTLLSGITGLMVSNRLKHRWFWVGIIVLTVMISFGSNLPFVEYLWRLPGVNLLRVPSRGFLLIALCFSILAGYCVDALGDDSLELTAGRRKVIRLFLFGMFAFVSLLMLGVWLGSGKVMFNLVWGWLMGVLSIGWLALRVEGRMPARIWVSGVFLICLIDLGVYDRLTFQPRTIDSVMSEGRAAAEYLAGQRGIFRIYSPSYSLPQHTASEFHLQLADGVDPMQLNEYAKFMEKATGVPRLGYSVTIPPFSKGDPKTDNMSYQPSLEALGILNVKYIVSEYDLNDHNLIEVARFGETRVYENWLIRPRAWVEQITSESRNDITPVSIYMMKPDQIILEAEGPGRLVLSEINYPGWRVWIDGQPAEVLTSHDILRSVDILAGSHKIEFVFHPLSVYCGLLISCFTILGYFVYGFFFGHSKLIGSEVMGGG